MDNTVTHDAEIQRLLALRRKQLPDTVVDPSDYPNAELKDGDVIRTRKVRVAGAVREVEQNLSHAYGPAPSTTGGVDILVIEARLVADGRDVRNPHVPADTDTLARAKDRIESEGLTPAWEADL